MQWLTVAGAATAFDRLPFCPKSLRRKVLRAPRASIAGEYTTALSRASTCPKKTLAQYRKKIENENSRNALY